jgi:hypothetical protein
MKEYVQKQLVVVAKESRAMKINNDMGMKLQTNITKMHGVKAEVNKVV